MDVIIFTGLILVLGVVVLGVLALRRTAHVPPLDDPKPAAPPTDRERDPRPSRPPDRA